MINVFMYVGIGTIAMIFPMILVAGKYGIKLWRMIPITIYAVFTGAISAYLWFVVENQRFGGISFFGVVFLVPIVSFCTIKLFRESFGDLMDIFAPGVCIMLAVMKVNCLLSECCDGRAIFRNSSGKLVKFPSQKAELINALVICVVIMILAYKLKFRGKLYPIFMILYGVSRFILNFFRDVWENGTIPYGTIWAIVSVIAGAIWIIKIRESQKISKNSE